MAGRTNKQGLILGVHSHVFLTFAEQGSLIKAAKVLGMHQSSISYHLAEFEKSVGIPLIEHNQKPCKLTPEGRLLYEEILYGKRRISNILEKLRTSSFIKPVIRFGIVESLSNNFGVKIICNFSSKAKEISSFSGTSERLLTLIEQRKIDWAITTKAPVDNRLTYIVLFREPSVLITPKNLFSDTANNISWDDLRFCGLPLLRYNRLSGGNEIMQNMLNSFPFHLPDRIYTDDGGVMLNLVKNGLGWSLVRPATLVQHPEIQNQLSIKSMPLPILERNILLVYRKTENSELIKEICLLAKGFFNEELIPQILQFAPWLNSYFEQVKSQINLSDSY